MKSNTMSYNKCVCQHCNSVFATMIETEEEIGKESCPSCGRKELTITEPLSFTELSSLFQGG